MAHFLLRESVSRKTVPDENKGGFLSLNPPTHVKASIQNSASRERVHRRSGGKQEILSITKSASVGEMSNLRISSFLEIQDCS